jgi:hypothetical protein
MFSGLLARNTADKIVAICAGLAVCSGVLLIVDVSGIAARLPGVLLDDRVFGQRVEPAWPLFAAEVVAMVALLLLLRRRAGPASALGIGWSLLMLAETIADVGAYRGNAYFVGEEGGVVLIYLYLLGLFTVYGCGRFAEAAWNIPEEVRNGNGNHGIQH